MVIIKPPPPVLSSENLSLFYTTDELLSNSPILVFYGPSATTTAVTNSRVQVHIYSPAGFHSYPRLTISPSSPLYAAVDCLAREEQGDGITRALAFSLYKYFAELASNIKEEWDRQFNDMGRLPSAPKLFSEAHAAIIASRMARVENGAEVIHDVTEALAEQTLSWIDVDVVLPPGTMKRLDNNPRESNLFDVTEEDITAQRYGSYAPILRLLGQPAFLPTSKLRRAPSRPTALNRTLSFSRKQKENLRREMVELLDTEESYVGKLYDLIHSVAEDFREKARKKGGSSSSPTSEALKSLFPPSLDRILAVNTKFLDALRTVLDDTEDGAIKDLETTGDDTEQVAPLVKGDQSDVTGTLDLAQCLLEWFPQFSNCYASYIQAHAGFSRLLKTFLKETGSSFSKRVQDTGEQRLMSMLIEPVQRLPRYSLYIDNLSKQLPIRHPALKPLLKARDIISEICSRDALLSTQHMKTMDTLRELITGWPSGLQPQGRLVTAVDVVELAPPYRPKVNEPGASSGIFLLFSDALVMLQKPSRSTVTARGLLSDLESSKPPESSGVGTILTDLVFYRQVKLSDMFVVEVSNGKCVQLMWIDESSNHAQRQVIRNLRLQRFLLTGPYESKAAKFVEDFVKARVEGRFPEKERESHKWEARSLSAELGIFSAIFEEVNNDNTQGRREPATIRIHLNQGSDSDTPPVRQESVEVAASLTALQEGLYSLVISGANDYLTRDQLKPIEFIPVLAKRLSNYLQTKSQIKTPSMTAALVLRNQQVLKAIPIRLVGHDDALMNDRVFRPASPVKLLSNLFGGSLKDKEPPSPKKSSRSTPVLMDAARFMPPPLPRPESRENDITRPSSSKGTIAVNLSYSAMDSLAKLEDTFANYILALHARKGNVVGKSVRGRASADELAVNELYNALLEDPDNHQIAAQSQVDVLFAAFEKFLNIAWRAKMGPVISPTTLSSIQAKSDNAYPGDFEDFFRRAYADMAPQNQRAFQAVIKLLADLLDGTGNDSDRGTLTVAFAEVLVPEENPHNFISLLDRFVEDVDALFISRPASSGLGSTPHGSVNSETRSRAATGSLNSNTSLRKRFGLGALSRENSKSDHESKFGSILRTLSKTSHAVDSQPSSLSRGSLNRSMSTEGSGRVSPKRPVSRDRPTVLGAFSFEEDLSHSGFTYLKNAGLDTIGEVPSHSRVPPRKKRRSSLSDLQSLHHMPASETPSWPPQTPKTPTQRPQRRLSPSLVSSPSKPSSIPTPMTVGSTKTTSSIKKENVASVHGGSQRIRGVQNPLTAGMNAQEITVTGYNHTRRRTRGESVSGIPLLKSPSLLKSPPLQGNTPSGLSERPGAVNIATPPAGINSTKLASSPTRKLRMQSPQKLRERLQKEQNAISTAHTSLQAELSKIGEEISKRPPHSIPTSPIKNGGRAQTLHSTSPTKRLPLPNVSNSSSQSSSAINTVSKLAVLESHLSSALSGLQKSISQIEQDLASSLQVSESRARKLDELYREANAENEALYAKFNEELARITNRIRSGEGVDTLKTQVRERGDEIAILKREVARLKRENVGLRAQLKE